MVTSGHTDANFVLEQMPKKQYTRAQLVHLGSLARDESIGKDDTARKLVDKDIIRGAPFLDIPGFDDYDHNEDILSKAATTSRIQYAPPKSSELDYANFDPIPKQDAKYDLPFSTKSKVDQWLNNGPYPNYTDNQDSVAAAMGMNKPIECKDDENASCVSTKSAIRSKLLDKTIKVKQTLRKIANNNNQNN